MPIAPRYFSDHPTPNLHRVLKAKGPPEDQEVSTVATCGSGELADRVAIALNAMDYVQEAVLPVLLP